MSRLKRPDSRHPLPITVAETALEWIDTHIVRGGCKMQSLKCAGAVLFACSIAACGGDEVRWAGTISDSAGVTIVSNGDVGIWQPGEEWTVEEELRIGAVEGPAEYQIGQVGSLGVDSRGRIHVLDRQAQHIQVYTPDGIYEKTLGARGGGPGELRLALALLIGRGDTLLVPDAGNRRFTWYAPDGSSASGHRLDPQSEYPWGFRAAASGVVVEQIRQSTLPGEPTLENPTDFLVRLASDGTITDTLLTFSSGEGRPFRARIAFLAAEPRWDITGNSQIVLGVSDEYRLGIYADGQLERVITKKFQPVPLTDQDEAAIWGELERRWTARGVSAQIQRRVRESIDLVELIPAMSAVLAGPAGTIWVQHYRSPSQLSEKELASVREDHQEDLGAPEWEVFDGEGRYLGVVTMPERFSPSLFRDDKIYGVWRDELNVEYILRLRIIGDLGIDAT